MDYLSQNTERFVYHLAAYSIAIGFLLAHFPPPVSADEGSVEEVVFSQEEARFFEMYESSRLDPQARLESELEALDFDFDFEEKAFTSRTLEDYRGRTTPLEPEELVELLQLIGFEDDSVRVAWAVAMNESTGNPLAHNTDASTDDNSYGLFQVNMLGRMGPERREAYGLDSNADLFDPVTNAEVAYEMSRGGTDFGDWRVGPNAYRGDGEPAGYKRWLAEYPGGM